MARPRVLPPAKARPLAGAIAALRCTLGAAAYATPSLPAAPWVGLADSRRTAVKLFARTLGGRDLALGLGLLVNLARGGSIRSWTGAGALADLGDLLATVIAFDELPRRTRWLIVAVTAGAAALGLACLPGLEPEGAGPTGA